MTSSFPPAMIFILGALLIPLLKGKIKSLFILLLPLVTFYIIINLPHGNSGTFDVGGFTVILNRVDKLSLLFGYIFAIVTFIGSLYAFHVKEDVQHISALIYAGGALGVTFAGDVFSLYIFWEIMTVASTFLILARKTKKSSAAAYRYVLVHIVGGLCLLAGILLYVHERGTIEFAFIGLKGLSAWLIFIGIAINAAVPPMHAWLQDAYPEATVTGIIFLSALTTKSAIYLMARTFPGAELLIYVGAAMTAFPIFFAMIENDQRRVLCYSMINQIGFMLVGIGIGTDLSLNGTVAHAFTDILFKALLFMSVGAVIHRTGKSKCTELGGLYKTMPITTAFCIIGAASISAFPLFSGFVSKSMIVSAVGHHKLVIVWLILQFASAGVLHHAGIKIPFFTFFGHDSGLRPKEAPWNMLVAMGIAAFGCIFIGCFPGVLYNLLPWAVDYVPYTPAHIVGQLQLLMFAILAFTLLTLSGLYPPDIRTINLDTDWFYRKGARVFYKVTDWSFNNFNTVADRIFIGGITRRVNIFAQAGIANAIIISITPILVISGFNKDSRDSIRKVIKRSLSYSIYPVGLITIPVVIYLCLMFLL